MYRKRIVNGQVLLPPMHPSACCLGDPYVIVRVEDDGLHLVETHGTRKTAEHFTDALVEHERRRKGTDVYAWHYAPEETTEKHDAIDRRRQ